MEVGFHYGALCDPLEKQANEQGFTLGDKADMLQKLYRSMIMCWIHGLCTGSAKDSMMKKMHKKVLKELKPLKDGDKDGTKTD